MTTFLGSRFLIAAVASTATVAVAMAIPTAIIDNPWFTRMTATTGIQYFVWVLTSLLMGALLATYLAPGVTGRKSGVAGLGGGALGYLAIGCPICNKLVVALLGVSGALTYFAPLQPVLGGAALALAAAGLAVRIRALRATACATPPVAQGRERGGARWSVKNPS